VLRLFLSTGTGLPRSTRTPAAAGDTAVAPPPVKTTILSLTT